jgi:hypothetical protein
MLDHVRETREGLLREEMSEFRGKGKESSQSTGKGKYFRQREQHRRR